MSTTPRRRLFMQLGALTAAAALFAACTSNEPPPENGSEGGGDSAPAPVAVSDNDETGDTITIGFSAPAADHGWMGAITKAAIAVADEYDDIDLKVAEGTNDTNTQISHIETFINDGVDAIVLLPFDGAELTEVAIDAMQAGIIVVNVDREFSDLNAARTTLLGDNYGMGVSAGEFICEELDGQSDAVVAEIAGIDSLPLTQDRSQGFADALEVCGLSVKHRVSAEFTVESGEAVTANLLQAAPEIDAIWNHDDDQGIGVMAAIDAAGRDEFFLVGGAGSKDMMELIQDEDSYVRATVVYPSTQAADGIKLARLLAQGKAMSDLVEVEVPRQINLFAPVVTKDNVDEYLPMAFES